jgi:hypothetical protein
MDLRQLEADLLGFVRQGYPNITVRVEPWAADPRKAAVYFTEAMFAALYPAQRYHYLRHLIPEDYYERHLTDTEWFELAPGESPDDLEYADAEVIEDITPDVMRALASARFFAGLDDLLCPAEESQPRQPCHGDFRHARVVLLSRRFREDELFDVFHVLMGRGGYCDCEILYNAAEESRLKAEYWRARAAEIEPYDPHAGPRS